MGARRILALITARDLESASRVREDPDIEIFDVGAIDRERHLIF